MGILSWIIFPAVSPDFNSDPLGAGVTRFVLLLIGLIWLFVLSMIIVRQEEGNLRWATVKRRLRLNTPRDPKTGETRRKLWLWVIPFKIPGLCDFRADSNPAASATISGTALATPSSLLRQLP